MMPLSRLSLGRIRRAFLDHFSHGAGGPGRGGEFRLLESLESRELMTASLLITEFMAINENSVADEDGEHPDWFEIHNPTANTINLLGWHATDDMGDLAKWTFPDRDIQPGEFLLIFASDKDRDPENGELHTNFQLSGSGDNLALVNPALQVVHAYVDYPLQVPDVSYGIPIDANSQTLIAPGDPSSYLVPADDQLEAEWFEPSFDDSAWLTGPTGLGYEIETGSGAAVQLTDSRTSTTGTQGGNNWYYGYFNYTTDANKIYAANEFVAFPSNGTTSRSANNFWNGSNWAWHSIIPWTTISATTMRPNGTNSTPGGTSGLPGPQEHWAVRRYVAPQTTTVDLQWHMRDTDGSGTGVTLFVFKNGVQIDTASINGGDTTGVTRTVNLAVSAGDLLDFTLSPRNGANTADTGDNTSFWATVTIPPTPPLEAPSDPILVADSIADWSTTGTQGENSWTYGYFNRTVDANHIYAANEFTPFPRDGGGWSATDSWTGAAWDWFNGDPPWTYIAQEDVHPNGTNNVNETWVIRRYTSEVSGKLTVEWKMRKTNPTGTGVTGRLFHNGVQVDVATIAGTDATGVTRTVTLNNVQVGDKIDFVNDPTGVGNDPSDGSDGSALSGKVWVAPDIRPSILTDVASAMHSVNASMYVRIPFTVEDPEDFNLLTLRMKYDDGFVALLNGVPVAASNAPASISFSSSATAIRPDAEAVIYQEFNLTSSLDALLPGENVLAIQALNGSANNPDLLILPELEARQLNINTEVIRYFTSPTPDATNGAGATNLGPIVKNVTNAPTVLDNQNIIITAEVAQTVDPIATVQLTWRTMYGSETLVNMVDNGTGDDELAGDGIYTATIPAAASSVGQMVRWFVRATDTNTATTRVPTFDDPLESEQYYGTIIQNPALVTDLPTIHWFIQSPAAADSAAGGRGSIYYNGEFYDNVLFNLHGQSTTGFPKKSYDVDFTRDHRFLLEPGTKRMKDINLLTNYADKSKIRNTLAYETYADAGGVSHLAFPMRVHQNGNFFSVADFVEDGDDRYLERNGLDPEGALYKMYNTMNAASGEKKTRKTEGFTDLQNLINGINLTGTARTNYFYDNINLPEMATYLASMFLVSNTDCCHKNYYAYRDTNGTGEWTYLPWDQDLSFGRVWTGSYFDDTMYSNVALYQGSNNTLISALYALPAFKEMYLRRVRTLMDELVQPPGTPYAELKFENRVDELVAQFSADANLDNSTWSTWGQVQSFQQATDIMKNQYLGPRREFLYYQQTVAPPSGTLTTLISGNPGVTQARYLVPTSDTLGSTWTQRTFNDATWTQGATGIGYERDAAATYTSLLSTDINSAMTGRTTFFTRIPFNIANTADIDALTLKMKYDDGFVAYINGVEVARRNVAGAAGSQVLWTATASDHPDSQALVYENINITSLISSMNLVNGTNVLSIAGVNSSSGSSDLLILPELVEGVATGNGEIPLAQVGNPLITVASVDFNPTSGNQDQEYIQFTNPNLAAVDISGWHVAGAVDHTFAPGTVIPAGGSVYLTPDSKAFRARTTGPRGGQGLFVQGGFDGHLSNFGETIELYGSNNALVSSHTYTGDPTDQQEQLRITEVNYNPSEPTEDEITAGFTDNDQFEFIELRNISGVLPLSLLDVEFVSGVSFNFTGSAITMLAPGERVLIVADSAAFTARYGAGLPVAGQYTGSLSNDGETIKIEDSTNSTVAEFSYSDSGEWPGRADGNGSTLHVIDIDGDYNAPGNWRSSGLYNGSPGAEDVLTLDVIINEVLSHTDLPQRDSIELYNTTGSAIDLSGWWISDSKNYTKFQIPNGVMIDAHGYLLFDEEDFNPTPETPAANHFSFDGAHGEEAHLLRGALGNPVPLSFADGAEFDAALNGVSFGRVPNGDPSGELFPNITPTPNAANSDPKFGPLMIAEVMYHAPGEDNDLEYIELYNSSRTAIDLTNWRLAGAADFDFAPGTIIGPRQSLVILGFDPLEPLNADKIAAFELAYGVTIDGDFIGPFLGNLADEGERVKLQQPDEEPLDEPGFIPHPLHDEVKYDDAAPWSLTADGLGDSLHRYTPKNYGHTATSWRGQPPTPGRARGDINGDDVVSSADIDMLFDNAGSASPLNDLTTDGNTDTLDIDLLVQDILCTFYGDADLNQQVSIGDLTVLAEHFGEVGTASWSTGDFNGDDSVSIGDLTRLAENFGSSNSLTGDDDAENGDNAAPAGLQALGDGTATDAEDDDDEDDDTLIDILADLGNDLR